MKIGILTYHASHNYGAFLQAYALCELLIEETGNDVEIVNFNMSQAEVFYESIVNSEKDEEQKAYKRARYEMFKSELQRNLRLEGNCLISDDIDTFREWIHGRYDTVIVGSDEVWKIDGFRGFPNPYWLPGDLGCKKISYAASSRAALSNLTEEQKQQIKGYISDFEYIGVRDEVTKDLIHQLTGRSVYLNCDPTFAYDFYINKELGKWLLKTKYHISGKKKCIALMITSMRFADSIVRKYGKDFDFVPLSTFQKCTNENPVLNPFEWIQVIAGCDGLITNFFHGTVFAIKGNTPFVSFEIRDIESDQQSKIYDLLQRNSLENHYFRFDNPEEQSLRIIAPFLADVISGKARKDYTDVCNKEKELLESFLKELPDVRPNHIVISRSADCCGCGACVDSCPQLAIKLVNDEKGFWYPHVDEEICINCGRCKDACAFSANKKEYEDRTAECGPFEVYGVKHKDEAIRMQSRSGGVFTAISDRVLEEGGSIYGAALTDDFLVVHRRATTSEERDLFRGSKYVQSSMNGVYGQIKGDLRNGRSVLFSGTPCQVAAIKKAMEKEDCSKLYLLDIVCHGFPSQKVWEDYLECREKEHNGRIETVDFRDNQFGWKAHRETFVINGIKYDSDDFAKLFISRYIERVSCFECPYKSTYREGDITIADFWGIDDAIPGFNDDKGVSLVIAYTEKGKRLFDLCKEDLIWESTEINNAMQNSLRFSYPEPAGYYNFWEEYKKTGMKSYLQQREQMREEARKKQEEARKKQEEAELRKQEEEKRLKEHKDKQQVKQRIKSVLGKIWRVTVGD